MTMALISPELNITTFSAAPTQNLGTEPRANSTGIIAAYIVAGFVVGCMLGSVLYCLWPSRVRRAMRTRVLRERILVENRGITVPVLPL